MAINETEEYIRLKELEKKWTVLIEACKNYYLYSQPTGLSDAEYDALERQALEEDNFSVRDFVFTRYINNGSSSGRYLNSYIQKIKKETLKVDETMTETLKAFEENYGEDIYIDLKYDGSSLAIYLDPTTGKPQRVVTVGNLNIADYGVDQTEKLLPLLPPEFPKGIVAIQAEGLVDIDRFNGEPERSRQKANGLINSKYQGDEVRNLLTLRAYRYYTDDSPNGIAVSGMDYREVMRNFPITVSQEDRHIMFAPADVFTTDNLGDWNEEDIILTSTGRFLADGMVIYDQHGTCIKAVKFSGAGKNSEQLKTKVLGIQWNDQSKKGKDSWSANVIVEPIKVRGVEIKKPSAGSVNTLIKKKITRGAEVSVILANSTIPKVHMVFKEGDGNFNFPKCKCGYQMSEEDIYGSNLKCGNPECTERLQRMRDYLDTVDDLRYLSLDKLLVIDRFKWLDTDISTPTLVGFVVEENEEGYYNYLYSYLKTDLQKRNLDLVWRASYIAIRDAYKKQELH